MCNSKHGVLSVRVNDEGLPLQTAAVRWKFTKSFDFLPLDLRLSSYSLCNLLVSDPFRRSKARLWNDHFF